VHGGARKAGKTSFAHAGACQDIDVLITNKGFPEDMANELIALNIKVIET
jgi:DeoR/GlpR family transcriptional regulator of sugar metabolism